MGSANSPAEQSGTTRSTGCQAARRLTHLRFLADENFIGRLLAGLRAVLPDINIVRVQDTDKVGLPDPELLAWAAEQGRILVTHYGQTNARFAYNRVRSGLPMPGIMKVRICQGVGAIIDDVTLMIGASTWDEFENQVLFVPFL